MVRRHRFDRAETGLGVSLNFHAVYNRVNISLRSRNFDDQPRTVVLPADQAVDIVDSVELRHITLDGNIRRHRCPRRRSSGPFTTSASRDG